jgi:phosphoglycolate phosphatase
MKAILFDLDGTLLDTLRDIVNSCNAALARYGYPAHPADAYKHFIGDGVDNLIMRALPESEGAPGIVSEVAALYREEYHRRWSETTRVYDGVPELLDELSDRRLHMAVLSNKPHDFTCLCVERFLSRWKFAAVLGASKNFPPKPDPASAWHIASTINVAPEEFACLGDTATDMRTAVSARMCPVGVLWGFRSEAELRESGAKQTLAHPLDALQLA